MCGEVAEPGLVTKKDIGNMEAKQKFVCCDSKVSLGIEGIISYGNITETLAHLHGHVGANDLFLEKKICSI